MPHPSRLPRRFEKLRVRLLTLLFGLVLIACGTNTPKETEQSGGTPATGGGTSSGATNKASGAGGETHRDDGGAGGADAAGGTKTSKASSSRVSKGGSSSTDASTQAGGRPSSGGTKGSDSAAGGLTAGGASVTEAGGASSATGTQQVAGSGGCTGQACVAKTVITYPDLPGAERSPLYTVTVNGTALFVEKLTKYSPEMQVHYAHCSLGGSDLAKVEVTVKESFSSYKLSPKSRKLATSKSGNTVAFSSGPNYLIFQPDAKDLLFILLDPEEENPPSIGDANVKNIADYEVDATGKTLETKKIQSAIDAASGASQNVLYFPAGKYKVGELWLKSNMTLYLAGGAILYGADTPNDFNTGSGGIDIEGCSHGVIRMFKLENTKVLGRGIIDGNGKAIRAQNDTKLNLFKIEQSSKILIDGILVRDPSFWNTLIYRSDEVTLQNYKMINCRPTTTTYNNTDGVNFDESTNGKLYNAFLYTGDDSMATKNEEPSGTINTKNILHEKVVAYSNSVGCKIGTKTMGQSMSGVTFKDIDVVKAGRALNIDAYDTAVVENIRFEDVRIEAADSSIIALELNDPPDWRECANTSIMKDIYFTNVSADVKKIINLHGKSASVNINGVHFKNFTVGGKAVTSQTDGDASWNINSFVSNITFE